MWKSMRETKIETAEGAGLIAHEDLDSNYESTLWNLQAIAIALEVDVAELLATVESWMLRS